MRICREHWSTTPEKLPVSHPRFNLLLQESHATCLEGQRGTTVSCNHKKEVQRRCFWNRCAAPSDNQLQTHVVISRVRDRTGPGQLKQTLAQKNSHVDRCPLSFLFQGGAERPKVVTQSKTGRGQEATTQNVSTLVFFS